MTLNMSRDDQEIRQIIKRSISDVLEGEISATEIGDDDPLFRPACDGGLDIDSLAALEILVVLAEAFSIPASDVEPEALATVSNMARYVEREMEVQGRRPLSRVV